MFTEAHKVFRIIIRTHCVHSILVLEDLLKKAEDIAFYKHLCSGTVVISGIGVRGYEKFGYKLENNYMVKEFNQDVMEFVAMFLEYIILVAIATYMTGGV